MRSMLKCLEKEVLLYWYMYLLYWYTGEKSGFDCMIWTNWFRWKEGTISSCSEETIRIGQETDRIFEHRLQIESIHLSQQSTCWPTMIRSLIRLEIITWISFDTSRGQVKQGYNHFGNAEEWIIENNSSNRILEMIGKEERILEND